jgi:hypothetical protein
MDWEQDAAGARGTGPEGLGGRKGRRGKEVTTWNS